MIIVLKKNATDAEMQDFIRQWKEKGYGVHVSRGEEATILGLLGDTTKLDTESALRLRIKWQTAPSTPTIR